MKQKDSNSLEAIHGGGCKEMAGLCSLGAALAAATLNPVLMAVCAVVSVANAYENC
jgi:hypothetical protein